MNTPVAFFVFNRPATTQRVFEAISAAKPRTLLVVADGPRNDRHSDREACAVTRAIIERIDWQCDVLRQYSDDNQGCRKRVSSGLDWVFSQVPEAIVLEDDCLPSPEFFGFCTEVLDRYRDDERVMHIGGTSFQQGNARTVHGYYFSKYTHIWGWATWRRAWQLYDVNIPSWPQERGTPAIKDWFDSDLEELFWTRVFDELHAGSNTWDGQWTYACLRNRGLAVVPSRNLISNIGFGLDATHTHGGSPFAELPLERFGPIVHPDCIIRHKEADVFTFEEHYGGRQLRECQTLYKRVRMAAGRLRRAMLGQMSQIIAGKQGTT